MKREKHKFFIEMTDTYGGEANYCWVNRFLVTASSERGAIGMVTRRTGYRARSVGCERYDVPGACICYFVQYVDADDAQRCINNYSRIEVLP
jgi:hypothetical protein